MADDKPYPGYTPGETPRKIIINGRGYPVNYMIYRAIDTHLESLKDFDLFRLSLTNYGECNVAGHPSWTIIEPRKTPPKKLFKDMVR